MSAILGFRMLEEGGGGGASGYIVVGVLTSFQTVPRHLGIFDSLSQDRLSKKKNKVPP